MVYVLLTVRLRSSVRHGRPTFGPSCTEIVYPESWHFDNGATSQFDDILLVQGGLPHVFPLAVHLIFG